jgi:hypothetical protein
MKGNILRWIFGNRGWNGGEIRIKHGVKEIPSTQTFVCPIPYLPWPETKGC